MLLVALLCDMPRYTCVVMYFSSFPPHTAVARGSLVPTGTIRFFLAVTRVRELLL